MNTKAVVVVSGDPSKHSRLAGVLRLWLELNNVTQKELAGQIGCSQSSLTRFLNGKDFDARTTLLLFQWLLEKPKGEQTCKANKTGSDVSM